MKQVRLSNIQESEFIQHNLGELPRPLAKPVLIILSGLPGSGKSHFGRKLYTSIPIAIIESDKIRKLLFTPQTYSAMESKSLFTFCHSMINYLMAKSIPVLFDATNLIESNREILYNIVDELNGVMIIIRIEAPEELIYERLIERRKGLSFDDNSSATWTIYCKMLKSREPIRRIHFLVDTSIDTSRKIETIVRKIKQTIND